MGAFTAFNIPKDLSFLKLLLQLITRPNSVLTVLTPA